jgi:hypothetical protein
MWPRHSAVQTGQNEQRFARAKYQVETENSPPNVTSFLFHQSRESVCASKTRQLSPWGIADDRK